MARFLKIARTSGLVLNVELWGTPPDDTAAVLYLESSLGGRGDTYRDGALLSPSAAAEAAKRRFTFLEFMDLFTEGEQLALAAAAMQSPQVKLWYDRAVGAEYVNLEDPRTVAGLDVMRGLGLLTHDRMLAVLAGMRP